MEAVQDPELGEAGQVGDLVEVGGLVLLVEEPQQVAAQQAAHHRRVGVARAVGVAVVHPVVGHPPQGSPLGRRGPHGGPDQLHGRGMRKARWENPRW